MLLTALWKITLQEQALVYSISCPSAASEWQDNIIRKELLVVTRTSKLGTMNPWTIQWTFRKEFKSESLHISQHFILSKVSQKEMKSPVVINEGRMRDQACFLGAERLYKGPGNVPFSRCSFQRSTCKTSQPCHQIDQETVAQVRIASFVARRGKNICTTEAEEKGSIMLDKV